MAYVRKVGKRWKYEIRLVTPAGPVHENGYRDTKPEAQRAGKDREAELKLLAGGGFAHCTVRELLKKWRLDVAPTRDGARWDINRLLLIERLLDGLGHADMPLQSYGPEHMAKLRELRLTQVSPPSVKREEALLRSVWAAARHPSWRLTDRDPFRDLGPIRGSRGRARRRKASWTELRRILRELEYHPRRPEASKKAEVGLAMMVSLRTTLRSQEVLQLGDALVDLRRLVIEVPKHKTRYVTNEAKRVPLLPKALLLLARKCLGRERYFSVSNASRDSLYRRARQLAMVESLTFHDLKRTAVGMLKGRLSDDELMAVTGNSDIEVLRRHYMTDTAAEASRLVWKALGADAQAYLRRTVVPEAPTSTTV
jgi:hypothetical protein